MIYDGVEWADINNKFQRLSEQLVPGLALLHILANLDPFFKNMIFFCKILTLKYISSKRAKENLQEFLKKYFIGNKVFVDKGMILWESHLC